MNIAQQKSARDEDLMQPTEQGQKIPVWCYYPNTLPVVADFA
jgi:hypothetical protein